VKPTADDVERHAAWRAKWTGAPSTRPVLADEALLAKLRAAQRLVIDQPHLEDAWRWSDVRRAVEQFGNTIPIKAAGPREPLAGVAGFAYEFLNGELVVFPDTLRAGSIEHVAEVLVHEATHVVFARRVLETTKLTPKELTGLCTMCADVDTEVRFATEALAYRNEAVWIDERAPESIDASPIAALLRAALDALDGGPGARAVFAAYLRQVDEMSAGPQRAEAAKHHAIGVCGPPVVARGPRHGEYFFPSDVARDFLVPLFDAIE
jgi:hypothetical protein